MMNKNEIQALTLKLAQVITFLVGVAFTAYNLFSFKIAKNGYYFNDDNQIWLAFGLSFLALTYIIKNWNKL
jgi:hypothetical protein